MQAAQHTAVQGSNIPASVPYRPTSRWEEVNRPVTGLDITHLAGPWRNVMCKKSFFSGGKGQDRHTINCVSFEGSEKNGKNNDESRGHEETVKDTRTYDSIFDIN